MPKYIWVNGEIIESDKVNSGPSRRFDINAGERLSERVPRIENKEEFEKKRIAQGGSEKCVGGRWVWNPTLRKYIEKD